MSYQDDKRELLKLKQGLIEESEEIKEKEESEPEKMTFRKKVENFFYHYKFHVLVGIFFAFVGGILIADLVTKETGDVRVLYMSSDNSMAVQMLAKQKDVELTLEMYCPDFSNDGNVHCEVYHIDNAYNPDGNYQMAYQAKLFGEFSMGIANMFITDKLSIERVCGDDVDPNDQFINLEELYPDNENMDGIYYSIKDTDFAKLCGWDLSCPDLYIVIRDVDENSNLGNIEERKKYNTRALIVFDNIINGVGQGITDTHPFLEQ